MKKYNIPASEIVALVSSDPSKWEKFREAIKDMAIPDTDVGDLEPGKFIDILIEKIWNYK
jgi:hypothetical protein